MSAPNVGVGPSGGATLPRPRRFRPKKILKGLVVLIIGMVIGSAATAHFGHHLIMKIMGDPAKMGERLHHRLDRNLDLTPEQSAKIGAIIDAHTANFSRILQETHPRLMEQFDQMSAEISRELTPEQAAEWDRIHERMKKRFPPPFLPAPSAGSRP